MQTKSFFAVLILAILFASCGADVRGAENGMNEGEKVADAAIPANPAMAEIEDVPGLPRVLLIGDSISIAYTLKVRALLKDKANVHRVPANSQGTATVLSRTRITKTWLGEKKWDVIHFNCGVWDAKIVPATGLPSTSREDYVKNLKLIVERLKANSTIVIFATTTPIPASLTTKPVPGVLDPKTRLFESIPERNELAIAAMKELGIPINDLYSAILPQQAKYQYPNDVHYSPEGSEILAQQVAESIKAQLPKK